MSDEQDQAQPQQRVYERPLIVLCQWCGEALLTPGRGPAPRYCSRPKSCRQRAYELRTAQARADADAAAGRLREEPVRQVIERVVQPKHPTMAGAWVAALEALTKQLRTGPLRHQPHHHGHIAAALAAAAAAIPAQHRPAPASVAPRPPVEGSAVWQALAKSPGGSTSVTLERLADAARTSIDTAAAVLVSLAAAGELRIHRGDKPIVDVTTLAPHARFTVTVIRRR
ncbi:hypothetical protein [Pilimelia columellifera]|uniref:Uncharacterized protein n=1 Tax=Pilimelia columellifera subsp. columellifera TaxID=706583 RepID=A0ABN3NS41_9ACTN